MNQKEPELKWGREKLVKQLKQLGLFSKESRESQELVSEAPG